MPEAPPRPPRFFASAAVALAVTALAPVQAVRADASCERPAITLLRYDEDYSFLRDPRCRTELWDPLKYLTLTHGLPVYLTLGIDVRERFEYFNRFDWGGAPHSPEAYVLQRVMPHAALHFGADVQVFFQLTSNLVWGRDPRPLDRDHLDVLQAFASLSLGSFTVRAGRQEVQYASSRLVSIREGPNVRLAFDGLRLIQHVHRWQLDAFALVPVQVRPGAFDDRAEPGQWFWGLYTTGQVFSWLGLDLYYLGRLRETAAFEQGTARELRHTVGARMWGTTDGWDYNVELAYQAGTFGEGTIAAWMIASDTGYTAEVLPARPRFGAQVNAVSGDSNPASADLQTFNPLFPRGAYFSQANLIGPLNLVDLHPALTLKPVDALEITLDWDFFWRESLQDGIYQPSTELQFPGAGNPARYVGSQGAVLVQWQITRLRDARRDVFAFLHGTVFPVRGAGQRRRLCGALDQLCDLTCRAPPREASAGLLLALTSFLKDARLALDVIRVGDPAGM